MPLRLLGIEVAAGVAEGAIGHDPVHRCADSADRAGRHRDLPGELAAVGTIGFYEVVLRVRLEDRYVDSGVIEGSVPPFFPNEEVLVEGRRTAHQLCLPGRAHPKRSRRGGSEVQSSLPVQRLIAG